MKSIVWGRIYLIFFLLGLNASLGGLHAHNRSDLSPISETAGVPGMFGNTHGGYGYIASSEAEAAQMTEFGCGEQDIDYYKSCGQENIPLEYHDISNVIDNTAEIIFEENLRHQLFEYLALQLAAVETTRPLSISIPTCLRGDEKTERLTRRINRLPAGRNARSNEIAWAPHEKKDTLFKYNAIRDHLNPGNMIRALFLHDQLNFIKQRACKAPQSARCTSNKNDMRRLRASNPALFPSPTPPSEKHVGFTDGQILQNTLRNHIQGILGEHTSPSASTLSKTQKGKDAYNEMTQSYSMPSLSKFEKKIDGIKNENLPNLNNHFNALFDRVSVIKDYHNKNMNQRLSNLCNNSMGQILRDHPNVSRQALIDMDDDERDLSKSYICQTRLKDDLQYKRQCEGVTGNALPSNSSIKVDRKLFSNINFGNDTGFSISRPPEPLEAPYEIDLTINYYKGPNISEAELQQKARLWQQTAQDWFNCQSGSITQYVSDAGRAVSCPSDSAMKKNPGIKFNIKMKPYTPNVLQAGWRNLTQTHPRPLVFIHKCFNSDLPYPDDSDCDKVREYRVKQCTDSGNPRSVCHHRVPASGSPKNNRADASNYPINTNHSTLIHEVGHLLGLDDEYKDPLYPINYRGEADSIMSPGANDETQLRLHPYHLDQILQPVRCVNPGGSIWERG